MTSFCWSIKKFGIGLSPLAGLTNLTWLFLNNNAITDISAVSGLTKTVIALSTRIGRRTAS